MPYFVFCVQLMLMMGGRSFFQQCLLRLARALPVPGSLLFDWVCCILNVCKGFAFGVCYEGPSDVVDNALSVEKAWVVGYNPPLLCYPHNKSREVEFPDLQNFTIGDQIGLLVTVCAELLVTRNGKEVLRVPLRGCPQRLPSMALYFEMLVLQNKCYFNWSCI